MCRKPTWEHTFEKFDEYCHNFLKYCRTLAQDKMIHNEQDYDKLLKLVRQELESFHNLGGLTKKRQASVKHFEALKKRLNMLSSDYWSLSAYLGERLED